MRNYEVHHVWHEITQFRKELHLINQQMRLHKITYILNFSFVIELEIILQFVNVLHYHNFFICLEFVRDRKFKSKSIKIENNHNSICADWSEGDFDSKFWDRFVPFHIFGAIMCQSMFVARQNCVDSDIISAFLNRNFEVSGFIGIHNVLI